MCLRMRISRSVRIAIAVSRMIPEMTQVALQTHKKDMMRETPELRETKVSLSSFALRL